jgi:PIN domain nuclease of toxin-antitoxin system
VIPRFLLDTHIVVRWLAQPKKLSQEQRRVLRDAVHRREPLALSGITLLEIALRFGTGDARPADSASRILDRIEREEMFRILPLTTVIAAEVVGLRPMLRDPSDCAIVATARVHGLTLLTSDQRIIASKLVPTIE